ncbi:MAG: glutamate 5-kinase [Chloroflexi bacterium]|nr:glutamate 5-kinase [Chloroflexota bacterium]
MTIQPDKAPCYRRVVVKLGTNLITAGKMSLSRKMMASLVDQVADLHQRGVQVIIVTSGAVAAGKHRMGIRKKQHHIPFRQMMAAIGQGQLMHAYDRLFKAHHIVVAQALLTKPDFQSRLGYLNARNTILGLLDMTVVPIVNENDVVFVEELQGTTFFGDNDNLSAMVANLVEADLLIILSDVAGLYTADPGKDPDARLIPRVEKIDPSIERLAKGPGGDKGTGGMLTKLQAAKLATASGTAVVIASGQEPGVISRLADGEALGTFFSPVDSKRESRERWMLGQAAKGRIVVDSGAKAALQKNHKSLLPAGIAEVKGEFGRGDEVVVVDAEGTCFAVGMPNYSSDEIERIKGARSDKIIEILGYGHGDEVIHRNNLVMI